jgi:hypothetical protein
MENHDPVNQMEKRKFHPALEAIGARRWLFLRQGAVVASWRYYRGRKYGPYYRLAWREDGLQRFVYLGREGPVVAEVRKVLAELHRPLRAVRAVERVRRQTMASLRAVKVRLKCQLGLFGLRLKGLEIRGWRTSSLSWLGRFLPKLPHVPRLRLTLGPYAVAAEFV